MMASLHTIDYDVNSANYFMRQALKVAKAALDIGEVPVGCVIVLRDGSNELHTTDTSSAVSHHHNNEPSTALHKSNQYDYTSSPSVIISHGANQVNATRDATRHAEMVAIDRMLTQSRSSDQLKLPAEVIRKSAHGRVPEDYSSGDDSWVNIPGDEGHWKNRFGWGSGRVYDGKILERCDLYVTCEPCIMVSKVDSVLQYE